MLHLLLHVFNVIHDFHKNAYLPHGVPRSQLSLWDPFHTFEPSNNSSTANTVMDMTLPATISMVIRVTALGDGCAMSAIRKTSTSADLPILELVGFQYSTYLQTKTVFLLCLYYLY